MKGLTYYVSSIFETRQQLTVLAETERCKFLYKSFLNTLVKLSDPLAYVAAAIPERLKTRWKRLQITVRQDNLPLVTNYSEGYS